MVPASLMQIDAIPLNQNGKVNRKALPEPTAVTISNRTKSDAYKPGGVNDYAPLGIL